MSDTHPTAQNSIEILDTNTRNLKELQERLDSSDPIDAILKPATQLAVENTVEIIHDTLNTDEITTIYSELREKRDSLIERIETLPNLSDDQKRSLVRDAFMSDVFRPLHTIEAAQYMCSSLATSQVVEVEEVTAPEEIENYGLRIVEEGDRKYLYVDDAESGLLISPKRNSFADYTEQREQVLKLLVAEGKPVSVTDMKEALRSAGLTDDGETIRAVRDWVEKIVDSEGQRLIEIEGTHNSAQYTFLRSSATTLEPEEGTSDTNSETPANLEVETDPIDAVLSIRSSEAKGTVLKIGKGRGKLYRLTAPQEESSDYSEQKITAIKLFEGVTGEVKALDIAKILEEKGLLTDENHRLAMNSVRTLLNSINFYGQKLIVHNGKRGVGSAYTVNPQFRISEVKDTRTAIVKKPTPGTKTSSAASKPEISDNKYTFDASILEKINKGELPVFELVAALHSLEDRKELMDYYGVPWISDVYIDRISKILDDENIKAPEEYHDTQKKEVLRNRFMTEFSEIVSDSEAYEKLFDLVDAKANDSDGHKAIQELVMSLSELEDSDWDLIKSTIIPATRTVQGVTRNFTNSAPSSAPSFETTYFVNESGEQVVLKFRTGEVEPTLLRPLRSVIDSATEEDEWASGFGNSSVALQPDQAAKLKSTSIGVPASKEKVPGKGSTPSTGSKDRIDATSQADRQAEAEAKAENDEWEEKFKKDIGDAITFLEENRVMSVIKNDGQITARQVSVFTQPVTPLYGTVSSVDRLAQAGVVKVKGLSKRQKQDFVLSANEVIAMILLNTHREDFNRGKTQLKRAMKAISEAVDSYYSAN